MITLTLVVLSQLAADVSTDSPSASRHLRAGVGSWVAMSAAPDVLIPGGGLTAHLGIQLADRYALFVQAQGATSLFTGNFTVSAMGELSLNRWLAVATGAGLSGWYHASPAAPSLGGGTYSPGRERSGLAVGAPLRLAFTSTSRDHHTFFVALDGFAGVELQGPRRFSALGGISLGYQFM